MHILIVISHPDKNSLSHALAERFAAGAGCNI
jgi:putative NADPH-quinone reductase